MKAGQDLQTLAIEIDRRSRAKKDVMAPVDKFKMESYPMRSDRDPGILIGNPSEQFQTFGTNDPLKLTDHAHEQLAAYLSIPMEYYRRMRAEDVGLLSENVNAWLPQMRNSKQKSVLDQRLIRTLDGRVRALLSPGYRPLDNEDLAEAVLPVLNDLGLKILSAELTETRFYIKAVDLNIERDVPRGHSIGDGSHVFFDTVSPAISIRNSEVGAGLLAVEGSVYTKMCTNLATFEASLRKYHSGARASLSDDVYALFTDETKRKTDEAIWLQARDIVRGAFNIATFDARVEKLKDATKQKITGDPVKVITNVAKRFGFNREEETSVLRHLIQGGDLSRYGVHSAVTRTAEDLDDYDNASQFEVYGGKIIDLPQSQWEVLAKTE